MKPHICPYCNNSMQFAQLLKHFGRCGPAMIAIDERLAAQAKKFQTMSAEELEVQIGIAMNYLVNMFVQEHGTEPPAVWLVEKEAMIRRNAASMRRGK